MTVVNPWDLPAPPEGAELHLPLLVGRLMQAVRETLQGEDWDGLRQSHFRLLSSVPADGISITDLAERLFMTKQAAGQLVTRLQTSGHLAVRPDLADRRVRVVVRTRLGDTTVRRLDSRIRRIEQVWARQVGEQRYAQFREVLSDLALAP